MKPGAMIKKYRMSKGWTQAELANKLHISRSYASEIEHDKRNMSVQLLKKFAKELDIPATSLIDPSYYVDERDRESFNREVPEEIKKKFSKIELEWENQQYDSSIKYIKDFFDDSDFDETNFKMQTVYLLSSVIKFAYINQPENINDDPDKIRMLDYIVTTMASYQNGEMPNYTQTEIIDNLSSIIKTIVSSD